MQNSPAMLRTVAEPVTMSHGYTHDGMYPLRCETCRTGHDVQCRASCRPRTA